MHKNVELNDNVSETIKTWIGNLDILCTICLISSVYIRYDIWLAWSISVNMLTTYDDFKNTGIWKNMMAEMLAVFVAPYSFLYGFRFKEYVKEYDTEIEYEVNDVLMVFMFFRLFYLIRFSFYMTDFLNPRTQRVCNIYGCHSDSFFALKAVVKQMPEIYLVFSLSISIFVGGYCLKIFEAPLSEASSQDFTKMSNAMWNMIITMTSCGYGDIWPKTFCGRIVGVIISFWGVLILSFFVVTVTDKLKFTDNELRSYNLIIRLMTKSNLKK